MLQSNPDRLRRGLGNLNALPPGDEGGLGPLLLFLRGFLHRQYGIIAFTLALALAAAVLYLRLTQPVYTAHVQILLANPKAQFVQQESIVAEPSFDRGGIDTQLQIINSPTIAAAVIDQLQLAPDLAAGGTSPVHP